MSFLSNFELFLYIATILAISFILGISVFRRPFNATKFTFSLFGFFLILWNFFGIFFFFHNEEFKLLAWTLEIILSGLTIFFLVLFSLNFPYYNRRKNFLTYYVVFLGGIGFTILSTTLLTPKIKDHSEIFGFHFKILSLTSNFFNAIGILSFLFISFVKLNNSVKRLRKVLLKGLLFIVLLCFLGLAATVYQKIPLAEIQLGLFVLDIFFLLCMGFAFSQFKLLSFYPGILSIFLYGEIPRLVIQKEAPATGKGASYLKNELWKIYEVENWESFLSEFWFSLIIDETIDNALEHGGKRIDDKITVQIFETQKFLDIYVADMGKGFDPSEVPDPSHPDRKQIPTGRGIHILKKLFPVAWNFLGNEIRVRVSKNPAENPKED